jgi:hypothetical protein
MEVSQQVAIRGVLPGEAAHRFYEDLGFQKTSYRFWRPIIDP